MALSVSCRPRYWGDHHRAAGGEGGKDLNDECIDVVHQRDAGYGGLAGGGDHDGIRHADSHQQKLLNDQGNDEPQQCVAGKRAGCCGPVPVPAFSRLLYMNFT